MERNDDPSSAPGPWRFFGVGPRLTTWIVSVFVVTLVLFVALDVLHEARFAESLGADPDDRAALLASTLVLHAVHLVVTVLAFALAIHLVVRRLVSRPIERLVLAIQHFRRGIWTVRIPTRTRDELEWLTEALRDLGPDLESKLTTFVEADRKSVVALLGSRYERRLTPFAQRILAAARERRPAADGDLVRAEVEHEVHGLLVEIEALGRPEHPVNHGIVTLNRSSEIANPPRDQA